MSRKACFIIDVSFSPPHAKILAEMRALHRNGYEVTIISVERKDLPPVIMIDGMRNLTVKRNGLYASPFQSALNLLVAVSVLRKALHEKADIYHCHGFSLSTIIIPLLKFSRKRVIYAVYDDHPSTYAYVIGAYYRLGLIAGLAERFFRFLEKIVCRLSDCVITLTEPLARDRKRYNKQTIVIPYGLDPVFNPHNKDQAVIDRFRDYQVVICSGFIGMEKGLAEILDALKIVRLKIPNILLLLVGEYQGNDKRHVDTILKQREDVIVTGRVNYSEMPKYINVGKISLVLPRPISYSYKIGVSFKLLENMACGLPVILSKGFSEMEKIVRLADCGLLVNPQSPQEIADAINQLFLAEELRARMGMNAQRYIKRFHDVAAMEKDLIRIYNHISKNREKSAFE